MGLRHTPLVWAPPRSASHRAAVRLAASPMPGPPRRAVQAARPVTACQGNPLPANVVGGGGRHTVALGLAERRPGLRGLGAQAAGSGRTRWAAQAPAGAAVLIGSLQGYAHRVAWLSEACRLAGHGNEAWQHAHQAFDLARQLEALALHQRGVVHAHAIPPDATLAEAYYHQALAMAEALGMRPLQAHCHRGLGILYTMTGQFYQDEYRIYAVARRLQRRDRPGIAALTGVRLTADLDAV